MKVVLKLLQNENFKMKTGLFFKKVVGCELGPYKHFKIKGELLFKEVDGCELLDDGA